MSETSPTKAEVAAADREAADAAERTAAQAEAEAKAEADAKAAAELEAEVTAAEVAVTKLRTADPSGVPAERAFAARIAAAKFEHREQGHDDTMRLIDELYAGVLRLEAELTGGAA